MQKTALVTGQAKEIVVSALIQVEVFPVDVFKPDGVSIDRIGGLKLLSCVII